MSFRAITNVTLCTYNVHVAVQTRPTRCVHADTSSRIIFFPFPPVCNPLAPSERVPDERGWLKNSFFPNRFPLGVDNSNIIIVTTRVHNYALQSCLCTHKSRLLNDILFVRNNNYSFSKIMYSYILLFR